MVPMVIKSLREPILYASWYVLNSQVLSSSLKNKKNSFVYPSGPGALLSLLLLIESSNSAILNSFSNFNVRTSAKQGRLSSRGAKELFCNSLYSY